MSRFAYVDGKFVAFAHATTHIEDRGYQFADSVYEVIAVIHGKFIDCHNHLKRLTFSLGELKIPAPLDIAKIPMLMEELVEINRIQNGYIYLQVSRGIAPRAFGFPKNAKSRLTMTIRPFKHREYMASKASGIKLISQEDQRWARVDIKTTNLLPSVLAKQNALENGGYEALYTKNGVVTECSSSNFWCVLDGKLHTHPNQNCILGGITKKRVAAIANKIGFHVEEKPFTLQDAYNSTEAFITAANHLVVPVTQIDHRLISDGKPGPLSQKLQQEYFNFAEKTQ